MSRKSENLCKLVVSSLFFFFYLIVMQMPGIASKLLKSSLHQMLSNFDTNFKECDTPLPTSSFQTQSSGHYILIKIGFFLLLLRARVIW